MVKRLDPNGWRKVANKIIAQEMDLGENYKKWLMLKTKRKMDLRNLEKVVKMWSMKDVEFADEMLRHRRAYEPEEFIKHLNSAA